MASKCQWRLWDVDLVFQKLMLKDVNKTVSRGFFAKMRANELFANLGAENCKKQAVCVQVFFQNSS